MKKNKHENPTLPRQRSREQLYEEGKALRDSCPRASHADWKPPADRVDPIEMLEASNKGRLPELIPVRYGRMIASPFVFYRGVLRLGIGPSARSGRSTCADRRLYGQRR
jgi:hypothetical protein